MDGDAFGDGDDELDFGLDGLEDRGGGARRRHVDHGGVAAGLGLGLPAVLEHRHAQVHRAGLGGRHAAHDLRPVVDRPLGVVRALVSRCYLFPRDPLADHLRVPVDEHVRLPRPEGSQQSARDH